MEKKKKSNWMQSSLSLTETVIQNEQLNHINPERFDRSSLMRSETLWVFPTENGQMFFFSDSLPLVLILWLISVYHIKYNYNHKITTTYKTTQQK